MLFLLKFKRLKIDIMVKIELLYDTSAYKNELLNFQMYLISIFMNEFF